MGKEESREAVDQIELKSTYMVKNTKDYSLFRLNDENREIDHDDIIKAKQSSLM